MCQHLRSLEEALLKQNHHIVGQFKNWTEEMGYRGYSIYFDCILDINELKRFDLAPKEVDYKEYGVAGQYAGFFCNSCGCVLTGYHPNYKKNLEMDQNRTEGPFI